MIDCPFTILVDSAETYPFSFRNLHADAKHNYEPYSIPCRIESLGRYPTSFGDYSIEGAFKQVAIERKSAADLQGTLLGWAMFNDNGHDPTTRRERFFCELENLNQIQSACVVVESSLQFCLDALPHYGTKPPDVRRTILFHSIISCQQRWPRVQWAFCCNRQLAEQYAFRWLFRYHKYHMQEQQLAGDVAG